MRYGAKSMEANLPEDIHFCGLVFEMVKQLAVSRKWFMNEYAKVKKKYNVQYPPSGQAAAATQPRRRTLLVQVECEDILLQVDDTALKQVFVNKNELADTLKERDVFKCRGQNIFKLLKKLKQAKLNDKVLILQAKRYKQTYDLPQRLLEFNQVYA
jgi:hypothetical protein